MRARKQLLVVQFFGFALGRGVKNSLYLNPNPETLGSFYNNG